MISCGKILGLFLAGVDFANDEEGLVYDGSKFAILVVVFRSCTGSGQSLPGLPA